MGYGLYGHLGLRGEAQGRLAALFIRHLGNLRYRLLRYRADLDLLSFVTAAGLDITATFPANLFGYSTVLVCRNRRTPRLPG